MDFPSHQDIELQYVYRQKVSTAILVSDRSSGRGIKVINRNCLFEFPFIQFSNVHSTNLAIKALVKLLAGKREYYFILNEDGSEIITDGWCNFGFCSHYPIEHDSVVVGEIFTPEAYRGQGLSAQALAEIIIHHRASRLRYVYIDTHSANFAAQRVFEKTGFGDPVFLFRRKS